MQPGQRLLLLEHQFRDSVKVMLRLADHYDVEVDRNLKSLAALIEPLALIVLGSVVGVVVSSVILPIFKMAQVIH